MKREDSLQKFLDSTNNYRIYQREINHTPRKFHDNTITSLPTKERENIV